MFGFVKFSDFVDLFIKNYANIKLEKSTLSGYKSYIKIHIQPYFGDMYIKKIKRFTIQQFINGLYEVKGLSPKTIKNVFSVLDVIMTTAVKWDYIKLNPCEYIDLPPLEVKETDFYNKKELLQLIKCLDMLPNSELKYKVAIEFAFLCGYRKSEIVGLDWDNVNLEEGTSKVIKKRIIVVGNGVIEGKPKTKKSVRVTTIPEPLLSDLKKLKRYRVKDSVAVISNNDGTPIYPQVLARWFDRFLNDNNLRHISLHKLRHTYASLLAYLDVDIKEASEQLGHAQATTTLNIYTHLFVDSRKEIATQITKLLY